MLEQYCNIDGNHIELSKQSYIEFTFLAAGSRDANGNMGCFTILPVSLVWDSFNQNAIPDLQFIVIADNENIPTPHCTSYSE
jgi:hypothetical protein